MQPQKTSSIGSLLDKHLGNVPGFNAMRVFAASLVVLSHSFGAAENREYDDPLKYLTSKLNLGNLAVFTFFLISGFVITQSCLRSETSRSYLLKRAARLLPGLVVVTLFCAFLIGPMVTSFPLARYFKDPKFYRFFLNCLFVLRGQLPGVFEHNPSGDHVNISLWTLRDELFCYVTILLIIVLLQRFSSLFVAGLAAGLVILAYPTCTAFATEEIQHLRSALSVKVDVAYIFSQGMTVIPFFFVGSLLYYARNRIPISFAGFVISLIAMVAIIRYMQIFPLFPFALGYATIYLGFYSNSVFDWFQKNDYSYGIYIFGFPIQQTLVTFFPTGMTWWANALLAYPIVLCLAALSWHFVERPSLRYARGLDKKMLSHVPVGGA